MTRSRRLAAILAVDAGGLFLGGCLGAADATHRGRHLRILNDRAMSSKKAVLLRIAEAMSAGDIDHVPEVCRFLDAGNNEGVGTLR